MASKAAAAAAATTQENQPRQVENPYIAVVAIDFGTTYSGFAFSFNAGKEKDEIFLNREWTNEQNCRTSKTPTCLLLKPDLSFDSFGYDAVEKYTDLESKQEERDYFFFQHFKMELHNNENLNKTTIINAANGRPVKALSVFAHSIKFMKYEALKVISYETGDEHFKADDIQWVLTVPAIWKPRAKQFMREAAYEAGLGSLDNPKQLIIALEPEAAAIFCMERKVSHLENELGREVKDEEISQPDTEYMVVDIGGGTLDVAVHRIAEGGTIKEIDKVTGGPYGGMKVNQKFKELLGQLIGYEIIKTYEEKNPSDWLALMNDFEGKKQGYRIVEEKMTNIRLPASFNALTKKVKSSVVKGYGENAIRFRKNEYLSLSSDVIKRLFNPVLILIKEHLASVLRRPRVLNVKTMLLVGGFADSALLRNEIRNEFSKNYRVLAPRNAGIAVLKGAVMFGKKPAKITERMVSTTYGAGCSRDFDKSIHHEKKRFFADGREKCKDLFCSFVKENEIARLGEHVKRVYSPLYADDTVLTFGFYVADNPDAQYITDKGVTKIGSVTVQSPDTSRGRSREIEVAMHFGGTEIVATAVDITSNNKAHTSLDFFHK